MGDMATDRMTQREDFLSRWSRLKRRGGEPVPALATAPTPATPVAPLPDVDTLAFGDDFSGFLRQEVEEAVRRVALKKLFHSAEFNVMDGLDIYIDDYTIPDPLDEATLRSLNHARELIFDTPLEEEAQPAAVPDQFTDQIEDQVDVQDEHEAAMEPAHA